MHKLMAQPNGTEYPTNRFSPLMCCDRRSDLLSSLCTGKYSPMAYVRATTSFQCQVHRSSETPGREHLAQYGGLRSLYMPYGFLPVETAIPLCEKTHCQPLR